jgi:hypothetical protein
MGCHFCCGRQAGDDEFERAFETVSDDDPPVRQGRVLAEACPETLSAFLLKLLTSRVPVAGPEQARSEGSINGTPLGCGLFWDAKPVENKVTILIPGAAMAASGSVEIVDGAKTTGVMRIQTEVTPE